MKEVWIFPWRKCIIFWVFVLRTGQTLWDGENICFHFRTHEWQPIENFKMGMSRMTNELGTNGGGKPTDCFTQTQFILYAKSKHPMNICFNNQAFRINKRTSRLILKLRSNSKLFVALKDLHVSLIVSIF